MAGSTIDVIYIAASARDGRYTRICVASIRRFYPDIPVKLLVGGPLEPGLADEVARYWNVGVADFPMQDYGWGFVKLEPLFRPAGERFMVIDSDTVMTGPVLTILAGHDEDLVVDHEDQSEAGEKQIYFDRAKAAEQGMTLVSPMFLFNSGQWFGRSGKWSRADFDGLITPGEPPKLTHPAIFKNGDQGVMNYVANCKVRDGALTVGRVPLMCWPGFGMGGLTAKAIAAGAAEARVIHWAGVKKAVYGAVTGGDILVWFEKEYYQRLPSGTALRLVRALRHAVSHSWRNSRLGARLAKQFG
jgi:hypothetical protein